MKETEDFPFQNQKLNFLETISEISKEDTEFWEMNPIYAEQATKAASLKQYLADPFKIKIETKDKYSLGYDLIKHTDLGVQNTLPFCKNIPFLKFQNLTI